MLFRKDRKHGVVPPHKRKDAGHPDIEAPRLYRIEFEMMKKGSMLKRRGRQIRQLGVTVDGSTRLVTSGDVVDEDTYQALLQCGAVAPMHDTGPPLSEADAAAETGKTPAEPR